MAFMFLFSEWKIYTIVHQDDVNICTSELVVYVE